MLRIASILYVECLYIAYILVNRPGVSRMRSLTLKMPIKTSKSAFYRGVLNATLSTVYIVGLDYVSVRVYISIHTLNRPKAAWFM